MGLFSRDEGASNLVTMVGGDDMAEIIRAEGFGPEVMKDSSGDPMVKFKVEGFNCNLFFYGVRNGRADSLQFAIVFVDKVPMEKVNEWNRAKRFLKAYVTKEGGVVACLDVDLEGGVTRDYLAVSLKTWRSSLLSFVRFVSS